jgi:hypothetical protein
VLPFQKKRDPAADLSRPAAVLRPIAKVLTFPFGVWQPEYKYRVDINTLPFFSNINKLYAFASIFGALSVVFLERSIAQSTI